MRSRPTTGLISSHIGYILLFSLVLDVYSWQPPEICSSPGDALDVSVTTYSIPGGSNNVMCTPVVIDVNGDSASDIIIISSPGLLYTPDNACVYALSGHPTASLNQLWNYSNNESLPGPMGHMSAAHTPYGGLICFPSYTGGAQTKYFTANLTCINFTGSLIFSKPLPSLSAPTSTSVTFSLQTSIITIDSTGQTYIVAGGQAFNPSGDVVWSLDRSSLYYTFVVSDLNGDGRPELIYPGCIVNIMDGSPYTAFEANFLIDQNNNNDYVSIGVADFDGDGNGDILRSWEDYYVIWSGSGTVLSNFTESGTKGSLVIRDLDSDGNMDFGCLIAGGTVFQMYTYNNTDGTITRLWNTKVNAAQSMKTGALTVDLTGDGIYEVLFADYDTFYIFGSSGSMLYNYSSNRESLGYTNYPVYVDYDGDNNGQIILVNYHPSSQPLGALTVFKSESWMPTSSVWTDWIFSWDEGLYGSSTVSPNWKTSNFFRGAINACNYCAGLLDPFLMSLQYECFDQQWLVYTTSSGPHDISVDHDSHLFFPKSFTLDDESSLIFVSDSNNKIGSINVNEYFSQNGTIIIDLIQAVLVPEQDIELLDFITFGSNMSRIRIEKVIPVINTIPSMDPCGVQVIQTVTSLSVRFYVSENKCLLCDRPPDSFFASFDPVCANGTLILVEPSTTSVPLITLSPMGNITVEGDFVVATQTTLNFVVSETGQTGTLNIKGSFILNGFITIDLSSYELAEGQSIELKQIITYENSSSSIINPGQIIVTSIDGKVDPCSVQLSQIQEQYSISLLITRSDQCRSESSDNTGLIVGLTIGLVGGCICILLVVAILFVVVVLKKKRYAKASSRSSFELA